MQLTASTKNACLAMSPLLWMAMGDGQIRAVRAGSKGIAGETSVRVIVEMSRKIGIRFLCRFYAFSTENWLRPVR